MAETAPTVAFVIAHALSLPLLLPPAPPGDGFPRDREVGATERARVGIARVRSTGIAYDALSAALALRVPGISLLRHDSEPETAPTKGSLLAFVAIASIEPTRWSVTVVVSDGRAFDRVVEADAGASDHDVTRLLASHVANLLLAIESGTVAPDREEVPIPPPAPVHPTAPPCPRCPSSPAAQPTPRPPAAQPKPALELGIGLAPTLVLGLGDPATADRFAAWGGEVTTLFRLRGGATMGLDVRVAGRGAPGPDRLVRARFALGAGYAVRRERFELDLSARVTAEPWWVVQGGERRTLVDSAGTARRIRPLVGGAIRVSPRWLLRLSPRLGLGLGPRLELAASTAPGDQGRVAVVSTQGGGVLDPMFRVGGIELVVGADVTLWIRPRL